MKWVSLPNERGPELRASLLAGITISCPSRTADGDISSETADEEGEILASDDIIVDVASDARDEADDIDAEEVDSLGDWASDIADEVTDVTTSTIDEVEAVEDTSATAAAVTNPSTEAPEDGAS